MRAIWGCHGHRYAAAALKLSALLLVRPGELRAAEWRETDLDDSVWRIPAVLASSRRPTPSMLVSITRPCSLLKSYSSAPRKPLQMEGEMVNARQEAIGAREHGAKAHIDLA